MLHNLFKCTKNNRFINFNAETLTNSMALHFSIEDASAESFAIELLKSGEVIAVPTDTIYGLACAAANGKAIEKLYSIKGRHENKPLAVCVGQVSDIHKLAETSHLPHDLLPALLPGPVTLVLRCTDRLNNFLTSRSKVGVRIPDHSFIRAIANGLQSPIALTSANLSNEISSVKITEFEQLWDKLGAVFDGGILGSAESNRGGSTVVDISEAGFYTIIRTGIAVNKTSDILKEFGLKPLNNL